jgi:hypothetical protein
MTEHDDRLPMHQMLEHAREAYVIWDTIADDFPPLVAALERVLAGEPD